MWDKNQLLPNHFEKEPLSGAVSLTKEGLGIFLKAYQEHKLDSDTEVVIRFKRVLVLHYSHV